MQKQVLEDSADQLQQLYSVQQQLTERLNECRLVEKAKDNEILRLRGSIDELAKKLQDKDQSILRQSEMQEDERLKLKDQIESLHEKNRQLELKLEDVLQQTQKDRVQNSLQKEEHTDQYKTILMLKAQTEKDKTTISKLKVEKVQLEKQV